MSMHDESVEGGAAKMNPNGASGAADETSQADSSLDDGRAEKALEFVRQVTSKMGMDVEVTLTEKESGDVSLEIHLEIEGPDAARIIGKKGQVLSALQYLANRAVNRPGLDRRYVIVDAEGYYARREETLSTMAKRLGKKAMTEGKIITFEPMSARDRRIVHMALADIEGVVTKSDGEGENRRVQIIPVRR